MILRNSSVYSSFVDSSVTSPIFSLLTSLKQYSIIPAIGGRTETVIPMSSLFNELKRETKTDYPKLVSMYIDGRSTFELMEKDGIETIPTMTLFVLAYSNEPADYVSLEGGYLGDSAIVMSVGSLFNDLSDVKYVTPLMPTPLLTWSNKPPEVLFDGERSPDGYIFILVSEEVVVGDSLSFRPINTMGAHEPFIGFGFISNPPSIETSGGFIYVDIDTLENVSAPKYLRLVSMVSTSNESEIKIGGFWKVGEEIKKEDIDVNLPNFIV